MLGGCHRGRKIGVVAVIVEGEGEAGGAEGRERDREARLLFG